jgi:hypothetical protein
MVYQSFGRPVLFERLYAVLEFTAGYCSLFRKKEMNCNIGVLSSH